MARKTINTQQLSFDFMFDTEEEKQVAQYNQTIETIIDNLNAAPIAEVDEIVATAYQSVISYQSINDESFLASSWLDDNLTAIKIANNYAKTNSITDDEKQLLLRYHGWGGLSEVFDERKYATGQFADARAELKELLTETEYRQAVSTTLTAMYTPMEAVGILQHGLAKLGAFDSNRKVSVLDPAAGTGRMFYNLENIQPTLIELDPLTAKISAAIFGKDVIINTGFEKSNVRNNVFDVVIANPPFGDFKVGDSQIKPASIHNYFMMKSIDALRDGGVGAFVVSRYFLDSKDPTTREYIANQANLISAYRLPSGIFPDTEVVVDILFFQKCSVLDKNWVNTSTIIPSDHFDTDVTKEMTINSYFLENTHNVFGQLAAKSNQYGDTIVTPMLYGQDKAEIYDYINSRIETVFQPIVNYNVSPEKIQFFGIAQESDTNPKVEAFIELKNILVDLLHSEKTPDISEIDLDEKRQLLNTKYDQVVNKYGYLNNKDNKTILIKNNIEHITSLEEVIQQSRGKVTESLKGKILNERVYYPNIWTVTTPDEALMYSLNTTGRVDSDLMSNALNCTLNEVIDPLIAEQKIFYNPAMNDYDIAARYLSGNVVQKLEQAQQAGLTTNVEALTAIQPEIIPFEQIGISLSAPWLLPQILKNFAKDNFDIGIDAEYVTTLGQWSINCPRWGTSSYINQTYATSRCDFKNVLESTIAGKSITIYDTIHEDGRQKIVANTEETKKVQDCQQSIHQLFEEWINTIPLENQREIEAIYNYKFNNTVLPNYDGSLYRFSSDKSNKPLYPHQKNAIVRSLLEGRALYDHVVGAGKTRVMVSTLLEGKQIGLWKKPIVVVPNHLIAQWGKEIHEDYPGSNICLATVDNMASKNRKDFLSQIMTNDYDLIVMGHSHFKHIGLDPHVYVDFIRTQINELEASIASNPDSISVKQQQRAIKGLESRLEAQIERNKQNVGAITIDEIGIDAIAVDEAHLFKNLAYTSVKQIAGLNDPKGSQRATDLLLKMHHIQEKYGRGTFLATGTPFSNSICEIYVMQKYLDNATLEQKGIASFDAWVDTFGEITKNWEISSSGQGYQMKERLSSFKNCPELAMMYRSFADVFTNEDLKNVGHIKIPTPSYEKAVGQPSEIQKIHFTEIIERVNKIQNGIDPREDNMLKLTSFAKNSALDPRIIDSAYSDSEDGKVNNLVSNVVETYQNTTITLGTQVIFCDSSTPKEKKEALVKNINSETTETDKEDSITSEIDALAQGDSKFIIYEEIRSKLIQKGIPPLEIAFIHDYNTDKQKQHLYDQVNSGEVRVILGSTSKLGAGTNMQKKLVALHHLDVPWRPSDLIQREGRIIRQGNTNANIKIHRYITEGTYDARSWQIIENKAKIAQQFSSSMDSKVRKIADVGMQTMNAAELKASATGNPYALYYVILDQEIKDLKRAKRSYENAQRVAQRFIQENTHESIDKKANDRINVIAKFEDLRNKSLLNNKTISDEENNRLRKQLKSDYRYSSGRSYAFTKYRGIDIKYQPDIREFTLESGLEYQLKDRILKYSISEMEHFSPRVLFKDIDSILNNQLSIRKQEIINQMELGHKDLDRFMMSQQKPFIQQERLTALEEDAVHCQNIIKVLQKDSSYQENWIPASIKSSIKDDMLPKGYIPIRDNEKIISSNNDVLNYYAQIDPEIIKIAKDTGYVTVKQDGYVPNHISIEADPGELAEALACVTGHKIQVEHNYLSTNQQL